MASEIGRDRWRNGRNREVWRKYNSINSCSSSLFMQHTSNNGFHLEGTSVWAGHCFLYGRRLAWSQLTYMIKSLISGRINDIIRFTEPLSLPGKQVSCTNTITWQQWLQGGGSYHGKPPALFMHNCTLTFTGRLSLSSPTRTSLHSNFLHICMMGDFIVNKETAIDTAMYYSLQGQNFLIHMYCFVGLSIHCMYSLNNKSKHRQRLRKARFLLCCPWIHNSFHFKCVKLASRSTTGKMHLPEIGGPEQNVADTII